LITPQDIDEQQLAERYLTGQLGATEQAEFEQHYTQDPRVLRDLQAVAGIKIGLALLRASGELQRLNAPRTARWPAALAIAASLLVAVTAGYWLRSQPPAVLAATASALTDSNGVPLSILTTYDLQRTRSDVDVTILKPNTAGTIQLRLLDALEPPPAAYSIELFAILPDDTRSSQAVLDALRTDDSGLLNVYIDAAALEVGSYELRLFKQAAGAERAQLSDFLIDVVTHSPDALP